MTRRSTLPIRPRTVIAALLAVLTLTACAGLPTSDTVEQGRPVLGQPQQGPQVLPDGPQRGAPPEQILSGFLLANVGFTDDHEVARSFLTEELATEWAPISQVVVYEDVEVEREGQDSVVVTLAVRGTVDGSGYLTEEPAGTTRVERFGMTRIAGQWRIEDFPEGFGLWLATADFDRQYRTATINYLAQGSDVFVPDVRWFPRYPLGSGLSTALTRAQLQRTPDYLRGAVRNALPDGVDLTANGVPVDPSTGTATVDLTGAVVTSSEEQQRQMWAQLTQTLLQAPGVSRVRLQSGGRTLEVPGIEDSLAEPASIGYSAATRSVDFGLLRVRDELTLINPRAYDLRDYVPAPDEELPELPDVPVRWTDLSADATAEDFAAVSVDRQTLWRWRNGIGVEFEGIGTELTAPHFDGAGGLWLAGRSASTPRVWHVDTEEALSGSVARPLEVDWLREGTQVLHFHVSPDDQRAVIHLRDPQTGKEELALTGVVRDREGNPTSLTAPRPIGRTIESVSQVEWVTPTTLVVLGRRAGDEVDTPYQLPIGAWVEALVPVQQAVLLRGVPNEEGFSLILLSDEGRLYTQEGNDWSTSRNGDDVVIPGH